jgi:hypothetical protein
MKYKRIQIDPFIPVPKKYDPYMGKKLEVFDQIDNNGDYCLTQDRGEPFVFIPANICRTLVNIL